MKDLSPLKVMVSTLEYKASILICPLASRMGSPGGLVVKNLLANAEDVGSIPGSGRSPGGRKWQPTPVFLPEKSHEQRTLGGYSPWGRKRIRHNLATKQ